MKPLVYIAGPYTKPCPVENSRKAMIWWHNIERTGLLVPFVPHWSITQQLVIPRSYEAWMQYDFDIIRHSQVMFRIDGESSGADREVELMHSLNRPVFMEREYPSLLEWARKYKEQHEREGN